MNYVNPDGEFLKRLLLHMKYQGMVVFLVVALYILIWRLFFYSPNMWESTLVAASILGLWLSTLIMFYFKLPHFNIPYTYSKNKKNLIYLVDIIIMTLGLIYYFFLYR